MGFEAEIRDLNEKRCQIRPGPWKGFVTRSAIIKNDKFSGEINPVLIIIS